MKLFRKLRRRWHKRKELRYFQQASTAEVFTNIYHSNKWGQQDTRSGSGSTLQNTQQLRAELPGLLEELQTSILLDIPCGDFHWMQKLDLPVDSYIGADIVEPLIAANAASFSNTQRSFLLLNLLTDPLPAADTILCRECLVHMSFADIARAIANIKSSGASYLLTTNFPDFTTNSDIVTGKHRRLNFCAAPWYWPAPLMHITEQNAQQRRGRKDLAVWHISDLP